MRLLRTLWGPVVLSLACAPVAQVGWAGEATARESPKPPLVKYLQLLGARRELLLHVVTFRYSVPADLPWSRNASAFIHDAFLGMPRHLLWQPRGSVLAVRGRLYHAAGKQFLHVDPDGGAWPPLGVPPTHCDLTFLLPGDVPFANERLGFFTLSHQDAHVTAPPDRKPDWATAVSEKELDALGEIAAASIERIESREAAAGGAIVTGRCNLFDQPVLGLCRIDRFRVGDLPARKWGQLLHDGDRALGPGWFEAEVAEAPPKSAPISFGFKGTAGRVHCVPWRERARLVAVPASE